MFNCCYLYLRYLSVLFTTNFWSFFPCNIKSCYKRSWCHTIIVPRPVQLHCFVPLTTECFILCALARDVWHGHFVQDALGSLGSGPQLLLPPPPPLSRTHPALLLSQLLPYLPSSSGPVPCPGWGWGSPTETDQRKVRMVKRLGGFAALAPSHFHEK